MRLRAGQQIAPNQILTRLNDHLLKRVGINDSKSARFDLNQFLLNC
ncbi:Uncharacterized protein EbC_33630 [Erwinia billingiae Eb661]|uniref:Uncharacterized protein n=1 Tax=Erwinia billingiae (strain Eb661) TaxID=634500 RepID=D8MVN7_ERWBE|nr:Uncharacterized protein EbC_33630 [Erwinia billingiae Eb661]